MKLGVKLDKPDKSDQTRPDRQTDGRTDGQTDRLCRARDSACCVISGRIVSATVSYDIASKADRNGSVFRCYTNGTWRWDWLLCKPTTAETRRTGEGRERSSSWRLECVLEPTQVLLPFVYRYWETTWTLLNPFFFFFFLGGGMEPGLRKNQIWQRRDGFTDRWVGNTWEYGIHTHTHTHRALQQF